MRISAYAELGHLEASLRTGVEVVQRVVGSAGEIPVLVLTGDDDPTIPIMALSCGSPGLTKEPLVAEPLGRALRHALARSFADGQIRRSQSTDRRSVLILVC
ncbi:MAG: hypothetical protein AAGA65_28765 [Actinomycetota bacterium]